MTTYTAARMDMGNEVVAARWFDDKHEALTYLAELNGKGDGKWYGVYWNVTMEAWTPVLTDDEYTAAHHMAVERAAALAAFDAEHGR